MKNKSKYSCRSCKSININSILNLGLQPWCNNLLKKSEINKSKFYPLHLVYCNNCELLQLNYTIPKEIMFKNHTYLSGTTDTLKEHFLKLAKENKKQFNLKNNDLILDIGGNDGTQLIQYNKIGIKNTINIESANNIAEISKKNNINTINNFFNYNLVKKYFDKNSVKLINASGVFFHLEELHSVIRAIKYCLQDNGILIVQFMYAGTMIEKNNFDTIYHEHLCYYTIKSLSNLLNKYKLDIFDAYYCDIHSGSIIAKITHKDSKINKKTKRYYITKNKDKKYNKQKFLNFAKNVVQNKNNLINIITKLKNENKKIYCYGAPAKGNTLLNYTNIDNNLIDKCVEINKLKIGLYLPKSKIPIVKESINDIPDYYLLLSHNFYDEIIKKNKELIKNGLKFIIPFPKINIKEFKNL